MSYYVTHENSVLNINNAHLKVSGNVQTDVLKLGAIEFAPPASDVPGTVNFTNVTTGVTTTSNLNVGGTLMLGSVELAMATNALEQTVNLGNTTSNTVQFTNATTGLVATGNVEVGGELTVSGNTTVSSNLTVSGNVGINTSSPASGLHVRNSGGADVPSSIIIQPASTQYGRGHTKIEAYPDATVGAGTGLKFYTRVDSGSDFDPASLVAARMTIGNDGFVGIGTEDPSRLFHVHQNLPTTSHHIMARIGGDTSSYNTLVFGSKEGRPHIGGHRGDFGTWADLSLQDDKLIISQGGNVNVNGTLQIQSFNAKRVLIGYEKYENNTGSAWANNTSGYQNAWSVNYVRKKAGSLIYVTCDLCMAQAMGNNGTSSYRYINGRLKVYDQVTDRFSNSTRDWQRIDNSAHEYQRQSRIYYGPHTLPGALAGWTVTVVAQVAQGGGTGTYGSYGINIWNGRSVIEVYETIDA